nr:uncharacterized protein LOC109189854 [Ipomoea batatas]
MNQEVMMQLKFSLESNGNFIEAEAIGIREVLKWLKEINVDNVQVEFDYLQDIQEIAREFLNICFVFIKLSMNRVAHVLAKKALSKSDFGVCLYRYQMLISSFCLGLQQK